MSATLPAADVRDAELAAYQRAARLLLVHGVVTRARPNADALALVRRWAVELDRDLRALAGYRVEASAAAVRLVRVLDHLDPGQPLAASPRRPFDRKRYALLCLVLAVLERSGAQITLSDLARRVRAAAAEAPGLDFDPDRQEPRRAFCHAVQWLEQQAGALTLTDGSLQAWQEGSADGEALYDIDREVCRALFHPAAPLHGLGSLARLLHVEREGQSRDPERRGRRQAIVRLLLERPVVYFDDLDEATRRHAQSEARALARDLERLTGARLERRREGLALVDAGGGFSDQRFPWTGRKTETQVALLLIDRIARRIAEGGGPVTRRPSLAEASAGLIASLDAAMPDPVRAGEGEAAPRSNPPAAPEAPFVPEGWLFEQAQELCRSYGGAFRADVRADPDQLLAEGLAVLERFDLVRRVPGGVVPLPALARFRDVQVQAVQTALPLQLPLGHP